MQKMSAHDKAVRLEFNTKNPLYSPKSRRYQGVPSIAISRGGRTFVGWCSGGDTEPRMENYDVVHYSDDQGKTWCKAPLVAMVSDKEQMVHVFDVQLFIDHDGALHVVWIQDEVSVKGDRNIPPWSPEHPVCVDGDYVFDDLLHYCFEVVCDNPDAERLKFSKPRAVFPGFLRCNPLRVQSGKIFAFAYDQLSDRYTFNLSGDGGKTYERVSGGKKLRTPFDEAMAYETREGAIRMLARSECGELAQSYSYDDGKSWTDGERSGISSPSSRFFVSRTPSGRVILIHNDHDKTRTNMTVRLSEDDGRTWAHSVCIDTRSPVSYPDADFYGGRIYMVYDYGRTTANEILLASFTEQDIIDGIKPEISVISKPGQTEI